MSRVGACHWALTAGLSALLPLPLLLLARPPAHHRGVAAHSPINVIVTPDDSALTVALSTTASVSFEVTNPSSVDGVFNLSCAVSGAITSCMPDQSQIGLSRMTSTDIAVTYTTSGSAGSGSVVLTAVLDSATAPRDSGSYDFAVIGHVTPSLTQPRQNDSVFNRGHCLTTSQGPVVWSCGDAMVMLTTPTFTTLDKSRPLTLSYASNTANPHPIVAANVTIPYSPYTIDHIRAVLTVGGTVRRSVVYTAWNNATKQIALDWDATSAITGAYYDTLTVYSVVGSDSTSASFGGITTVVNRRTSEYGAGWEWDGVERIIGNEPVGTENILWIGGDGSTALFHNDAPHHYLAPRDGFVDTLSYEPSDSVWTLKGQYGVVVHFDFTGRHTETINRQGQATRFFWHDDIGLDSIQVAPLSAHKTVTLHHIAFHDLVDTIRIGDRRTRLEYSDTGRTLARFVWPDVTYLDMYYTYGLRRLDSLQDDRGARTHLTYGPTSQVTALTQYYTNASGGSDSARLAITPWQAAGFASGTTGQTAGDTATAVTTIDGPPADSGFATVFHIDQWGAPVAERDAYGAVTTYQRGSANAPGEVSQITYDNGRTVSMYYDVFANVDSLVDGGSSPFPTQTTTWAYGSSSAPESPTAMHAPDGTTTTYTYSALGLLDTMVDARGHMTVYHYITSGAALGQIDSVTDVSVPTWIQHDSAESTVNLVTTVHYDSMGNSVSVKNPAGGTTLYYRDAVGRVTGVTNPMRYKLGYFYDAMNRDTLIVSQGTLDSAVAGCDSTGFTCSAGNPVDNLTTNPVDTRIHYSHGFQDSVVDERGVPHSYRYDLRGLLVADVDERGLADSNVYDHRGLLTRRFTRNRDTISFVHDALGRDSVWTTSVDTTSLYGEAIRSLGDTTTSTYDVVGNLLVHRNRHGDITRSYYPNGVVATEAMHPGALANADSGRLVPDSVAMIYNSAGQLASLHWRNGDTLHYRYDSAADLVALRAWLPNSVGGEADSFAFQWDAMGRRRSVRYLPYFNMQVTSAYDRLGVLRRLVSYDSIPGGGTMVNRFNFQLFQDSVDVMGRPLHQYMRCPDAYADSMPGDPCGDWMPSETKTRYYLTGAIARQTTTGRSGVTAVTDSFGYDGSGNRTYHHSTSALNPSDVLYYPDHSNRLDSLRETNDGGSDLIYYRDDLNGARHSDLTYFPPSPDPHNTHGFQYDAIGRMVGSAHAGYIAANSCHYDPDGRMFQACGGEAVVLLGDNVIRDQSSNWTYIHAPGIDEPLLAVRRVPGTNVQQARLQMVSDGGGQLLSIADSAGLYNSATSTPGFGLQGSWVTGGLTARAQTFSAQRWTTDSNVPAVSTFRTRQYDPQTGAWLQEDHIGLAGGINLYQYNGNDPNSRSDPFGTIVCFDDASSREELANATRSATRSNFRLDANGCIIPTSLAFENVQSYHDAGLNQAFADMVNSPHVFHVGFCHSPPPNPQTGVYPRNSCTGSQQAPYQVTIASDAVGGQYNVGSGWGKCFGGNRGRGAMTLPQAVAHELYHHYPEAHDKAMESSERLAVENGENAYLRTVPGAGLRCDHGPEIFMESQ
jgi:RHS repeat-associated protein